MRILMIVFCIVFVVQLTATIINIPADQPTIQAGINISVDGDTVLVQPGTYFENIEFSMTDITLASLYTITQDTTFISQTIIDGGGNGSVVLFPNGSSNTACIIGFTITNGNSEHGGGIYYLYGEHYTSNLTISDVILRDNTANAGGGFWAGQSSNTNFNNVVIKNNHANNGGGIFIRDLSNLQLTNVKISNNYASYLGGGIYIDHSYPVFDSLQTCNIYLNYAGCGNDLYLIRCYSNIDLILDTLTVINPDNHFIYPIERCNLNILNGKIEQVNSSLFVSPYGSDNNSGLTAASPLQTIKKALITIIPREDESNCVFLMNGTYSNSNSNEAFPLNIKNHVPIIGENRINTILNGENDTGILYFDRDSCYVENVSIINGSSYQGGGIYAYYSFPKLSNITVIGNDAYYGGGLYLKHSNSTINRMTIYNNEAYAGGGMYCEHSDPTLSSVYICNNNATGASSSGDGGGINCKWNSNPVLINTTICNNSGYFSGGLYCKHYSNPILINSIMWGNSSSQIYLYEWDWDNSVTITFSDIENGINGIVNNNPDNVVNWLEGNIQVDPLFADSSSCDFSLLINSPCIDTGTDYFEWSNEILLELDSDEYYGLAPDIGAFEYGYVQVDDHFALPHTKAELLQNYPNPFNPTTIISFSILEESKVELSIYNIKGQKIKSLLSDQITAGEHSIIWNGEDAFGKKISSGIYLYKLNINGKTGAVKKCLLLK